MPVAFGASWRSNGDLVFAGNFRSGLSLMPPGSTDARPLTVLTPERQEASHRYPAALPEQPLRVVRGARREEAADRSRRRHHRRRVTPSSKTRRSRDSRRPIACCMRAVRC